MAADLVTIVIDGVQVRVPKGMNLIEAAARVGIEIPHYCYHPHLSIAGNCRMCQVQLQGVSKLTIACNTGASEGMVVQTHRTSSAVVEAQRATLEFLLINHPLDCTVCDQAGHCKLQDYYYEYNAKPSRFAEEKVRKVKAEPLGPEVIYDGERCILCTRCVRFCEEVTGTSELGLFNRGDHAVIGVTPGHELTNPLSGSVVDLCPVGALTHRRWRFNTRIWYTNAADTICAGCSTGCNVKAYVRDGRVVNVKARLNAAVNKEWLCDEGRYGFERFQPENRVSAPSLRVAPGEYRAVTLSDAAKEAAKLVPSADNDPTTAVFLSPSLTLEEVWFAVTFAHDVMRLSAGNGRIAMQVRTRVLTDVERVLVSPDYAANARAATFFGIGNARDDWRESLAAGYVQLLEDLRRGQLQRVLFVGDGAVSECDADEGLHEAVSAATVSVQITPRAMAMGSRLREESATPSFERDPVAGAVFDCSVVFPSRTVNEKNGVVVNGQGRFQRLKELIPPPLNSRPEWQVLNAIARAAGRPILPESVSDDRGLFREMVKRTPAFAGLSLARIGMLGVSLEELREEQSRGGEAGVGAAA